MLERFSRSLSLRLLAIFLVMGVLFAAGAVLGVRWVYSTDELRELVSGHLSLHVAYVRNDIGNPPRIDRALAITRQVPVDIRIEGPGLNWASDPRFPQLAELKFGGSEVIDSEAGRWLHGVKGVTFATLRDHSFLKLDQGPYAIIVSSPKIAAVVVERHLIPVVLGYGLILVLLTYLAVRWLFVPIDAIRRGAEQIGRGNLEYRIAAVRSDQLGDLANDINRMAADVRQMLDAKRQLLLGISHELRSPLSRMKLALELSEDRALTQGMRGDVEEMSRIITTLLEAERLNTHHAILQLGQVGVRALVDRLIDDYFPANRSQIRITGPGDLLVCVDEARVMLMLKNLISNALRFTRPGDGTVSVDFGVLDGGWQIAVSDLGPGISAQQVAFIGEPFHRGDPSRARDTGGSGLGLYLARLIATAHGGTLELDQSYTQGARFVARFADRPGGPASTGV
jgi:signal transduction histidine kinase